MITVFKKNSKLWQMIIISAMAFAIFIITILAIVGTVYMQKGYSLDVGSVSPRRFDAGSTIENTYATQRLREEAMENVLPVYTFDSEVQELTINKINEFFEHIESYRNAKSSNPYTLSKIVYNSIDTDSKDKFSLSEEQLNVIDSMDQETYDKFKNAITNAVSSLMEMEIKSENDIPNLISVCMDEYFVDFTQKRYSLASYMLNSVIVPNCIIDAEATQTAKIQKAESVEPVLVQKNQKVIDEGEIIDEETLSILKDLGYVDAENAILSNLPQIMGTSLLVLIIFFYVIYFLRKYLFGADGAYKRAAVIFTIYICLLISTMVLRDFHYTVTAILIFTFLASLMTNTRTAIALNAAVTVICCFMYGSNIEFLLYYISMGTIIAVAAKYSADRTQLMYSVLIVVFMSVVTTAGITLMMDNYWKDNIIKDCIYAFLTTGFSYIIAIGSLPLFETFFGIATNVRLLELINPNRELLRKLLIEAPGTYHHSLIVANLAEAACSKIGANAVVARVGAYYHDIGKLKNPYYFTENIIGKNPHDDFEPQISANIIMNHIKDGLELADKYKLPEVIKKIIRQHHGTSVVRFFYCKAKKIYGDESVKREDYCYKYELPDTKESAVVMLADMCEASVRSMLTTGKSAEEIENFINKLVQDKIDEHQFIKCDLSFRELNDIIGSFMEIFNGMYHKRIKYPDDNRAKDENTRKEEE